MSSGVVAQLWRYPVKSMGGSQVESARLGRRGLHADRLWAVRDLEQDMTASARRLPALLRCTAAYVSPPAASAGPGAVPEVVLTLPSGESESSASPSVHALLSSFLDRDVRLVPLSDSPAQARLGVRQGLAVSSVANIRRELGIGPGEPLPDVARMRLRELVTLARYSTPPGTYVDLSPVHLLTSTSLARIGAAASGSAVVPQRFRPTALLGSGEVGEPFPEAGWTGRSVTLGDAVVQVTMPTVRCVVPSRPQAGLPADVEVTRAVVRHADRFLGAYADVIREGRVTVGDVWTVSAPPGRGGVVTRAWDAGRRRALRGATAVLSRL